jgi:hypothetical protein
LNKDPDYALKLEKAIEKKYGAETIVNPKSLWTEEKERRYLEDLKIFYREKQDPDKKVELDGVLLSEKLLSKESTSKCPNCFRYSPSFLDKVSLIKFDCCFKCYVNYVEHREEEWLQAKLENKKKRYKNVN